MVARNLLLRAPPYAVERAIRRLGDNLRTARLRRNLTIQEVADKIGTGRRAVFDAEKGKPSTGVAVYIALLWTYDLLDQMSEVGDPALDEAGLALASDRERARAKEESGDLNSDF